jgi:hypothetical protein
MRVRGAAAGPKGDTKYFDFLASGGTKNNNDNDFIIPRCFSPTQSTLFSLLLAVYAYVL